MTSRETGMSDQAIRFGLSDLSCLDQPKIGNIHECFRLESQICQILGQFNSIHIGPKRDIPVWKGEKFLSGLLNTVYLFFFTVTLFSRLHSIRENNMTAKSANRSKFQKARLSNCRRLTRLLLFTRCHYVHYSLIAVCVSV